ncbi:hypothetical protein C2E23DRAFT_229481 [Lenzites betulinus]|nr:hypothetical protein C2E23DRAFT_229481 [Lenzites betulinus]
MSQTRLVKQRCHHDGCDYVSTGSAAEAVAAAMSSHQSRYHRSTGHILYNGKTITVRRDPETSEVTCPCGHYRSRNISQVQKHSKSHHGGRPGSSLSGADIFAKANVRAEPSVARTPVQSATAAGSSSKSRPSSERQPISAWRDKLASSLAKQPLPALATGTPAKATALKRAREDEGDPGPSSKAARLFGGVVITSKSRSATPRPSKAKFKEIEPLNLDSHDDPLSSVAADQRTCILCSKVVVCHLNYWKGRSDFTCSACTLKRSAKHATVPTGKYSGAEPGPSTSRPSADKSTLEPVRGHLTDMVGSSATVRLRTCDVCLKKGERTADWKKANGRYTCGACVTSEATKYQTATHRPAPAVAQKIPPRPRPRVKHAVVPPTTSAPKEPTPPSLPAVVPAVQRDGPRPNGAVAILEAPQRPPVINASTPASRTSTDPGALPALASAHSEDDARPVIAAVAKPQKARYVTKKMRAQAFRYWLDGVLDDYYRHKAAGNDADPLLVDRNDYQHARVMQRNGGTVYSTARAFQTALVAGLEALVMDKGAVLQFYGGYSIVAQPKIGHSERGVKVQALLRDSGLMFDESRAVHGRSMGDAGRLRREETSWRYPCMCGRKVGAGSSKHSDAIRKMKALSGNHGTCGGDIVLTIGDDFALLEAYGIKGQFISLRVQH